MRATVVAALVLAFIGLASSCVVARPILAETQAGWASYCAPTPRYCHGWGGKAKLAAVASFRYGDKPYRVSVCREDNHGVCTVVTVVSYCACGNHIIDLSPSAFTRLAPLSRGVVKVVVSGLRPDKAPSLTLPPTDTEPEPSDSGTLRGCLLP